MNDMKREQNYLTLAFVSGIDKDIVIEQLLIMRTVPAKSTETMKPLLGDRFDVIEHTAFSAGYEAATAHMLEWIRDCPTFAEIYRREAEGEGNN